MQHPFPSGQRVGPQCIVGNIDVGNLDVAGGRGVLGNRGRGIGQRHRRRGFIHVGDVDRDGLRRGIDAIKSRNLDLIAVRISFVIRCRLEYEIAADDVEQRLVGTTRDRERRWVGADGVGIRRGQCRNDVVAALPSLNVVLSATDCVALVIITGALSFTSVTLTVMVFAVVLTPSKAETST